MFLLRSNLFRSLFRAIIIIITYQDGCYLLKNAFVAGIAESFICWPACKNYRQGGIVGGGGGGEEGRRRGGVGWCSQGKADEVQGLVPLLSAILRQKFQVRTCSHFFCDS